jgi:AraC family transcriptional regulator of adaptative response / DNA-3-methyladenine glycosylase II
VPGAWDGFELAVRAILGQQVSVRGATTLVGRLVDRFGEPARFAFENGEPSALFPTAETLAEADVAVIGLPRSRAFAINALARAVAEGALDFESPCDLDTIVARLVRLPGIGDWTAQYIAMRAANEPDAFPANDLGLRRAVVQGGRPATEAQLRAVAENWRPWRAYAAMLLWTQTSRIPPIEVGSLRLETGEIER